VTGTLLSKFIDLIHLVYMPTREKIITSMARMTRSIFQTPDTSKVLSISTVFYLGGIKSMVDSYCFRETPACYQASTYHH
jgi:hypothetical protein